MGMTFSLPDDFAEAVEAALQEWERSEKVRRLWERDATLWTGIGRGQVAGLARHRRRAGSPPGGAASVLPDVESGGYSDALLLGMGGSSLAPRCSAALLANRPLHPRFHVLDSTDPAQVRSFEQRVDLSRTLFIVASKSGTTFEPNALLKFFFDEVQQMVGPEAGARFTAITDPGSRLENQAADLGFLHVFHGVPDIGGRFSALSHFGLVPAATMGLDVARLLASATVMKDLCRVDAPVQENPGAVLGAILGVGGISGRDKITLIPSPGIGDLGGWLEQLIAESTGKQGKALIPVDGEPRIEADQYGADRIFVYLRLEDGVDPAQDASGRDSRPLVIRW